MKYLKIFFCFFFFLFNSIGLQAQDQLEINFDKFREQQKQDSIKLAIQNFYRYNFSSFDSLKTSNEVVYLAPVFVEEKVIVQDFLEVKTKNSDVKKVVLSSFEVAKRKRKQEISYFLIPDDFEMQYNRKPVSNYEIPFDALSSVKTSQSYWVKKNVIGLDFNQGAFSNWNAGGYNSISGIVKGDFSRKYEKGRIVWTSDLKLRYGLNKQENQEVRKTDDVFALNSTFGYRTSVKSNWYHSAKLTLNTQMANGYSYPNTTNPISSIFAPAYLFVGIGAEYKPPKREFSVYISPATLKSTFVLNDSLANVGAFGLPGGAFDLDGNLIRAGKKSKSELGFLVTNHYKKTIAKNVVLDHKLSVYTDYLHRFGNIDIDWQLQLEMTVNNFIKATIGTHLIYDDDIKAKREVAGEQVVIGPRIQFKQLLGIGLTYTF
nr:DUF3078 domain-containing protein [uncultured Flavobacterium sp.]